MIALEGYEIEEMRSINHIMTVELQFKTPVTQKEAREYLTKLLANASENLENANEETENSNEETKEEIKEEPKQEKKKVSCKNRLG